jgi:hypothetical protein
MGSVKIAILGIAIGFIHTMFLGNLSETWSTVLSAVAILLIFIGIVGLFKSQI